jgi:hypothetical protein
MMRLCHVSGMERVERRGNGRLGGLISHVTYVLAYILLLVHCDNNVRGPNRPGCSVRTSLRVSMSPIHMCFAPPCFTI